MLNLKGVVVVGVLVDEGIGPVGDRVPGGDDV